MFQNKYRGSLLIIITFLTLSMMLVIVPQGTKYGLSKEAGSRQNEIMFPRKEGKMLTRFLPFLAAVEPLMPINTSCTPAKLPSM